MKGMCMEYFSDLDRLVIENFFEIDYFWRNELAEQINNSRYATEMYPNAYYLTFSVSDPCRPISNLPRVPITILIEFDCENNSNVVYHESKCIQFENAQPSPVECSLYITDGYISEIEVFTLDGSPLELERLAFGKKHYILHFE